MELYQFTNTLNQALQKGQQFKPVDRANHSRNLLILLVLMKCLRVISHTTRAERSSATLRLLLAHCRQSTS